MTEIMESSQFTVGVSGVYTTVECKSVEALRKFITTSIETGELRPHVEKEFDCDNVKHPIYYRLKTVRREPPIIGNIEIDLYISCEDNSCYVKCIVLLYNNVVLLQQCQNDHQSYPGWKYTTRINLARSFSSFGDVRIFIKYDCKKIVLNDEYPSMRNLSVNLSQLLINGTYSDVTVTSGDGGSIQAHRGILAERSEMFRAALVHNETKDQITSHFNEQTLRQIMTFIYTDNTPEIGDFTADLFTAADYYQLSDLKVICVAAFYSQLKVENAIATLELAERHSLTDLLTFTLKFIKKNIELIMETKDWINIKSLELMRMVCQFIAKKSE